MWISAFLKAAQLHNISKGKRGNVWLVQPPVWSALHISKNLHPISFFLA